MNLRIQKATIAITLSIMMCFLSGHLSAQTKNENMSSYVSILEIPATDITRAISFYEVVLGLKIENITFPGMAMGLLPYENQMVTVVIMKGEGYNPSSEGLTVYLNGGKDLQIMLDKIKDNGGKVIVPKTAHADGVGFFAIFLDSEGNKMGLHSPN